METYRKDSFKETRTRDNKCFRCLGRGNYACPNKKVIILKDQEIERQNESPSSPNEEEVLEYEEKTPPYEGNLLMLRRLLESHPIELE